MSPRPPAGQIFKGNWATNFYCYDVIVVIQVDRRWLAAEWENMKWVR